MKYWIDVENENPYEEQIVWYYFEPSGNVYAGQYKKTADGHCFYGEHGWSINDVIWWMPIEWHKPEPPADYIPTEIIKQRYWIERKQIGLDWNTDSIHLTIEEAEAEKDRLLEYGGLTEIRIVKEEKTVIG